MFMFDDPRVKFFVVNAGGHLPTSTVQNPAWDLSWEVEDYEPGEPVGFNGRLIYTDYEGGSQVMDRYEQWKAEG
jgi:hypothetical protein